MVAGLSMAGGALLEGRLSASEAALRAESQAIARTSARLDALTTQVAAQPDWISVVRRVAGSIVTVEAGASLGSGWVVSADASGSVIVTNYHVVQNVLEAGRADVAVRQADEYLRGRVVTSDRTDDVAMVRVDEPITPLETRDSRPPVGEPVAVVGSPLGLVGTVTTGVVSSYRSFEGSDYIQFSAPISPGNSGGPVVDRNGRVIAVASAKIVGEGVEGLSLGIPVQVVCALATTCPPTR